MIWNRSFKFCFGYWEYFRIFSEIDDPVTCDQSVLFSGLVSYTCLFKYCIYIRINPVYKFILRQFLNIDWIVQLQCTYCLMEDLMLKMLRNYFGILCHLLCANQENWIDYQRGFKKNSDSRLSAVKDLRGQVVSPSDL